MVILLSDPRQLAFKSKINRILTSVRPPYEADSPWFLGMNVEDRAQGNPRGLLEQNVLVKGYKH